MATEELYPIDPKTEIHLLALAAPDRAAVDDLTARLAGRLAELRDVELGGIAASLAHDYGASEGVRRAAVCVGGAAAASEALRTLDPRSVVSGRARADPGLRTVFLFPGDGSQHLDMGRELFLSEPVFRRELETARDALQEHLPVDLLAVLYPGSSGRARERAADALRSPIPGHAALVAFEVALARLWIERGIRPKAVLGYSLGEYAAAVVAGVMSLSDALWLVNERARLMESTGSGAMLSVGLSVEQLEPLLGDDVSLAAVNGPARCVVSGGVDAVGRLAESLERGAVEHRFVQVGHGFHSHLMDPILEGYLRCVERIDLGPPRIPFISCVVGDWSSRDELRAPGYWVRHSREPIRFASAVEALTSAEPCRWVEVGPGTVLTRLVGELPGRGEGEPAVVPSCRHPKDRRSDGEVFLAALASLWVDGCDPDWRRVVAAAPGLDLALDAAVGVELEPHRAAPLDTIAADLHRAWSELLGVSEVEADDHFFRQGGDSLVASRLVARVRRDLGVEVPLSEFLREPTMERLRDLVERQSTQQPPISGGVGLSPAPVGRVREAPASYGQEALWLVEQIAGPSPVYNVPLVLVLEGPIVPDVLAGSFAQVLERHDALRTRLVGRAGGPVQVVDAPEPVRLPVVDLAAPAGGGGSRWQDVVAQEIRRSFDLERDAPARALLIRRGADRHVLVMTFHHGACDGWSLHLFLHELEVFYRSGVDGTEPTIEPLPIQYADFASWQRRELQGTALDEGLTFWRGALGDLSTLDLPTDRPRPATPSLRGGRVALRLEPRSVAGLQALAAGEGTSLFPVLLAAFQALMVRWCDQTDVVVGTPVAGRDQVEVERLIGHFVNTLALRTRVDRDDRFRHHLSRAAATVLAAFAHRSVPFDQVVEALAPGRETGRNPLYQVVLALQNRALAAPALPGVRAALEEVDPRVAKFDLTVQLHQGEDRVEGYLEYAADLFDRQTAERIARSYVRLLEGIVEDPDRRVDDLPLLAPEEERSLLFAQSGRRSAPRPELDLPVHGLVARWAEVAPDRLALRGPAVALTYGGLVSRARRLAARLSQAGAGLESRVGLCLGRSPELVTAALGVLEAGAAYLPLDPGYPTERLELMIRDAGVRVVVTDGALGPILPGEVERIELPAVLDERGADDAVGRAVPASTDLLAYVIYTSGSTGRPKGVQVPHRGLSNLVAWHRASYGTAPGEHSALVASPSFDASVWEIWPTLACGATLHVPPQEMVGDPGALVEWLVRERITGTFLPTPLAEALLDQPWPHGAALETILTGGDALRRRPEDRHPFRLVNHYGPTESSVVATAAAVESRADARPPAIGRAIDNLGTYVADRRLRLVPRGMPGELVLTGVGLARGYLDRPAATAERFVPNPFPHPLGGPGSRLYRTGDRVRLRSDGRLEFLGRIDRQVKIRGYRIEIGEVEAVLASLPEVSGAAAAVRRNPAGEQILVGYVEPSGADRPALGELRKALRARLPSYLVPGSLVVIDRLPVTPNGKLDRDALPAPELSAALDDEPLDGPVEETLGEIWRALLGVERVGAFGHFFELGGHSLTASRLAARVRESFGIELSLAKVMENPVLADLAWEVEGLLLAEMEPGAGDAEQAGTLETVPAAATAERGGADA